MGGRVGGSVGGYGGDSEEEAKHPQPQPQPQNPRTHAPDGIGEFAAHDPALAAKGPVLVLGLEVAAGLEEEHEGQAAQPMQHAQQLQPLRMPTRAVEWIGAMKIRVGI